MSSIMNAFKDEKFLVIAFITALFVYPLEHFLIGSQSIAMVTAFALIIAIVLVSMRVAHHAEVLAEKVGEPFGTGILTLCAVLVEVVILAIMMSHNHSPTLARDTIYAAVMLDMNGILGLAAILGGLKYGEQKHNLDTGKSYLAMIMTAIGLSMIVPIIVPDDKWKMYSVFTIIMMGMLYAMFLKLQTGEYSYFFSHKYKKTKEEIIAEKEHCHCSTKCSIITLVTGVVLIGALAEVMSKAFDVGMSDFSLPPMVAALIVASISASPEILTALRSALADRMQPVINIALGASLSTIILTVPVIEAIALFQGVEIQMGLSTPQLIMVGLTLVVSIMNHLDHETNAIEGLTHFALFGGFIMLAVMGV